jgi:hypothetical protein
MFIGAFTAILIKDIRGFCGRQQNMYVKPEAAITAFELLMMGGVSPETF